MIAKLFDVLGLIVGVAMTTVIVTGKNTSAVITAFGNAFSGSLSAAMGG
mgnify:CR=1 FL=1